MKRITLNNENFKFSSEAIFSSEFCSCPYVFQLLRKAAIAANNK
jgi:hypothetical protein